MSRTTLAVAAFLAAVIGLMVWASMGQATHAVKVCVTYQGRSNCGSAAGPTEQDALRAAQDNACAIITNGMTESMQCGRIEPDSVTWE